MTGPGEFMASLDAQLKPYRGEFPSFRRLPEDGLPRDEVAGLVERLAAAEEHRWRDGFASGAVYHGDPEHVAFLNRVYAAQSQSNPLHPDLWPSAAKFEAEIVSMTANMLGAEHATPEAPVVGAVSSGGTESILLAMKAYRDFARERRGIAEPQIVAPVTAHAAFDKAAKFFDMALVRVGVDADFKADLAAMADAVTDRTAVLVGSAPSFPHGVIDPIPALAALAAGRGAGCHVDACLGGFIVPWAQRLGYPVPPFDFRLPGVTSMSADTHKYGYAAKGSSVVLYRGKELRQFQFYTVTDWPGGLYLSPTFAGSRPGALSAECWAALVSIGERGYLDAARRILETGARITCGHRGHPRPAGARRPAVGHRVRGRRGPRRVPGHGEYGAAGMEPQRAPAAGRRAHRDHAPAHPARGGRPVPCRSRRLDGGGAGQPGRPHRDGPGLRHGRLAARRTRPRDCSAPTLT